jgi:ABC-2 type transport system permease protein
VVLPVVLSLVLSLVFGTLFSDKTRVGIADEDNSGLVSLAQESQSIVLKEYGSADDLEHAVRIGAVDYGVVLPEDFDSLVTEGQHVEITAYVWGESLAKQRVIAQVTLLDLVRQLSGREASVDVTITLLGDEASVPWSDRLVPLLVLMAVFVGGMFLPATSLVTEKQKRTLEALTVTPTTLREVFLAKGILAFIISLTMGIIILVLNQAFGAQPGLLVLMLALGAVMAAELGLILGAFAKDMSSLFAVWKSGGILLFAPALIYLFPEIPQWIGQIFPTYYLVEPVVRISQQGGGWSDIAVHVFVLIGLDVLLVAIVGLAMGKMRRAMA